MAIGVGSLSNQISDSVDSISSQLAVSQVPLVTTIEDSTGKPIAQLFDQYRLPVSYNQISPNMRAAIVDIEDHRFFTESGIDVQGTIRAALHDSSGGATQGASTLTQQYVKNYLEYIVDRAPADATPQQQLQAKAAQQADVDQSVARKLKEAKVAIQLSQTMSKNDILTGYLNIVLFGSVAAGPFGIGAAAQAYFGVSPDKLTIPQSALLAGMVNNPVLYNPYKHPDHALDRRNTVIKAMATYGSITQADAAKYAKEPLGVLPNGPVLPSSTCLNLTDQDTGFFCSYTLQYLEKAGFTVDQLLTGGYTIKTTLDPNVSAAAKQAANDAVPPDTYGIANSFVVIKPGTTSHDILAMVANRNYGTGTDNSETQTNILSSVADPFGGGSTYKLTTTAAAMELGKAGLNTTLNNPPCETVAPIAKGAPAYNVCNGNDGTSQQISLASALAFSPNTGFVNLELSDGMSNVLNMAYRLGMRNTLMSNQAGKTPDPSSSSYTLNQPQIQSYLGSPSFTLGVGPLSPLEHANMAATIGSGGVWCEPNPIGSVTDRYGNPVAVNTLPCEQIISQAEANSMLSGMTNATVSGTAATEASKDGWNRPVSAKTGTTQNNESVGFVAVINNYAVSSLVFADGSKPNKICVSSPPRLIRYKGDCSGNLAFGASLAAPTFFQAFEQILQGQPEDPIPGADPNFMN
ncbi:MAG TPA: transglycosylase domain-containing protein, partial [Pseudonocardiaceae bacterium]|nr:transglycosylase domain-containing protein [Pseudonocardiaceae bacterium]